ncbi:MAG TPA: S24/S26 family peptidase [Elusimicrobiota bacterium]|nr:S24/S26 family peptidase [Elusimicrobiota bacterium]
MPEPRTFDVRGGCMRGVLRPGDRVRVSPAPAESLRFGDIVVFLNAERDHSRMLSAHRLLWKTRGPAGWTLWTKGDALLGLDAPSPERSLVGRVVALQRGDGTWLELTGARAVWHRLVGAASTPLFLGPRVLAALSLLLRAASGPAWLRPARRVLTRLALQCEEL